MQPNLAQRRAYKAWKDQRQRCNNPNDARFYCYGAKGIKVRYSSEEFVAWYLLEYVKRENWKRPQCGRIDHSRDYTLDNIELVECSDNVRERNQRLGNPCPSKRIGFRHIETGEERWFPSKREAARSLGVSRQLIKYQCAHTLKRKPKSNWLLMSQVDTHS